MPGILVAQMYPAREVQNGILLPSAGGGWETEGAAAERVRPDAMTILAVGDVPDGWNVGTARRSEAQLLGQALLPGDRVMVRPYSGIRIEQAYGIKGLCFFGQTDPWQEDIVMMLAGETWRPMTNWVMVQLDSADAGSIIKYGRARFDVKATVLDVGPMASVTPGQRVVVADDMIQESDDDPKWLTTKWGELGEDVWLIREVDCEGVRRVVAELN